MKPLPSVSLPSIDLAAAAAEAKVLVRRISECEALIANKTDQVQRDRLALGKQLARLRELYPRTGKTPAGAKSWQSLLDEIGLTRQRAFEYMHLAGYVEQNGPDRSDQNCPPADSSGPTIAPSLREAGIKRDAPRKADAPPAPAKPAPAPKVRIVRDSDNGPDEDVPEIVLEDRDTQEPPASAPAFHCPECEGPITAAEVHCAACGEHVGSARPKCPECNAGRDVFVQPRPGRKVPTPSAAFSGRSRVAVAVEVDGDTTRAAVRVGDGPPVIVTSERRDPVGRPIPPGVGVVFDIVAPACAEIARLLAEAERVRAKAARALSDAMTAGRCAAEDIGAAHNRVISRVGLAAALGECAQAWERDTPMAVCPYCLGTRVAHRDGTAATERCGPCRGAGWVTRQVFADAPAAQKLEGAKPIALLALPSS